MSRRLSYIGEVPSIDEAIDLVSSVPGCGTFSTLKALQATRAQERELACREMDAMAKQFAQEDAARKKLWGNKFPRRLGDKPLEKGKSGKSINPVKGGKGKRGR